MDSDVDKEVNSALFGTDDEDDENDDNSDDVNHDTFEQEDDQDQAVGHDDCGEPDDAPVEAVPEEDGHVNAEGLIYQQPRAPFAGTIWNGTLNGFPRIDQENLRRPSGGKPNGYVWSMKINGWRRTLAQTLADEARLSEQSRMRATNLNSRGTNLELFGENVPNHSLLEISWYIVAMGTNAPLAWFDLICTAWENAIIKCGSPSSQVMMSYGRGERKEYGHLQGITRIMAHVSLKDRIRKWMRASLLLGTSQYRVKVGLTFFTGQDWTYMGGYIQKDSGKPHYRFFAYPPMLEGSFVFSLACK
jgi:hypothetical protein